MADRYVLCALFLFLYYTVEGTPPPIKGLYCQDPDTLKLYAVDSTWPSESFCGNYTCKLRKKNITQTEYTPITKINITTVEKEEETISNDMETSPSEHSFAIIKKNQPTNEPIQHKDAITKLTALTEGYKNNEADNTDRYLTESEIKSISEILHTVRKSDLEAIVEIYNIAQDIYKEIDTEATAKSVIDTVNTIKSDDSNVKKKLTSIGKDSASYWYEPLYPSSVKNKPKDLKVESTHALPISQSYTHPATYFKGPLTEKDFRKLPYYYPMSNFQRMSSYLRSRAPYDRSDNVLYRSRPCHKRLNNILPPWLNTPTRNLIPEPIKPQIMPPMLLPYPFSYVHHYNYSAYPANFYYNNYPWTQADVYKSNNNYYPPQYIGPYFTPTQSTAAADNVEELEKKYDDHFTSDEKNTEKITSSDEIKFPEWQTEQLSAQVLEEVKANVLDNPKSLKPLPLMKNVKLEKVGKVIKLDELTRSKRDTDDIDNVELENVDYEPYIESTTCESSTEPGYFRMGNLSEPYPACCPQKIS